MPRSVALADRALMGAYLFPAWLGDDRCFASNVSTKRRRYLCYTCVNCPRNSLQLATDDCCNPVGYIDIGECKLAAVWKREDG